jgi:fumarate hydratase class II
MCTEHDSLSPVEIPNGRLWGHQTQRLLLHISIGRDLMPRQMIEIRATIKKSAAIRNIAGGRLPERLKDLIVEVCDELFPAGTREWPVMTGAFHERGITSQSFSTLAHMRRI